MRARAARGLPTPSLDAAPDLHEDLGLAWEAFCALSARRQAGGFGVNPIMLQEIIGWLDLRGIDDHASRADLFDQISALDAEFVAYHAERVPKPKEPSRGDATSRNRRT